MTSGVLQCGSVIAPKRAGQGLAAILTEAACANARNSAQTLAIAVVVAGALTILASLYLLPARQRSRIAQAGPVLPEAPLEGPDTGRVVQSPPAGWYDDPQDPARIRYWDGTSWALRTAPKPLPPR
ncbi:MAG: DUF2510 domain-containing protein [Rhodococcus sp. (in: high G+C Gram-positive bacteria)]|uniref:DUF2510 domain-containing protein n=1 Tax=Rhodococcus sp. TaxID=1831 RepID=UPI003BB78BB8